MSKTEIQRYIENVPVERKQLAEKTVNSETVAQVIKNVQSRTDFISQTDNKSGNNQ